MLKVTKFYIKISVKKKSVSLGGSKDINLQSVQEATVLVAPPAEERAIRVHGLCMGYRLSINAVNVGSAFLRDDFFFGLLSLKFAQY